MVLRDFPQFPYVSLLEWPIVFSYSCEKGTAQRESSCKTFSNIFSRFRIDYIKECLSLLIIMETKWIAPGQDGRPTVCFMIKKINCIDHVWQEAVDYERVHGKFAFGDRKRKWASFWIFRIFLYMKQTILEKKKCSCY